MTSAWKCVHVALLTVQVPHSLLCFSRFLILVLQLLCAFDYDAERKANWGENLISQQKFIPTSDYDGIVELHDATSCIVAHSVSAHYACCISVGRRRSFVWLLAFLTIMNEESVKSLWFISCMQKTWTCIDDNGYCYNEFHRKGLQIAMQSVVTSAVVTFTLSNCRGLAGGDGSLLCR